MSVIYVLIPIAILLTAIGIYLFFWAVKTEQFDDLEKQGMSILFDDSNDQINSDNTDNTTQEDTLLDENNASQVPANKPAKK